MAHDTYTHAEDGRVCIPMEGYWFTPFDAGGEGEICDRWHGDERLANELTLTRASAQAAGSMLLDLQKPPVFRRRVIFEQGYNYLHETGPMRRGQHGMAIRFLLIGPHGASQFLMNTSWTPRGPVDEDKTFENGYQQEAVHCAKWELPRIGGLSAPMHFGYVRPPSGYDLGYHWLTPTYEGQEEYSQRCMYLGGRVCHYDGSGLGGEEVLEDFMSQGERAVWRHLVKRYRWSLEAAAEYEKEHVHG